MKYRLVLKLFRADVMGQPIRSATRARAAARAYTGGPAQRLAHWSEAVERARRNPEWPS